MRISGHLWTIGNHFVGRARPTPVRGEPWSLEVRGPDGPVRLHGALRRTPGSRGLMILIHGLGGGPEAPYLWSAARAAHGRGWDTLRIGMRGADGTGEDIYHAAISDDLRAAIEAPEFADVERVGVWGYSLGGHIALHLGLRRPPERLVGIAAVCSPLDLERGAQAIDSPRGYLYRRSVLSGLVQSYAELAARREPPTPLKQVRRVRTLRDWDRLTVVKRFGFETPENYYEIASAGPRLARLDCPALFIASESDPMVPFHTVRPWLDDAPEAFEVRVTPRGGHVGFPADLSLGLGDEPGLEAQVLAWFDAQG